MKPSSITEHLDQIRALFAIDVAITIIIRADDMPDGQDIVITNDDLDQVVGTLLRRDGGALQ